MIMIDTHAGKKKPLGAVVTQSLLSPIQRNMSEGRSRLDTGYSDFENEIPKTFKQENQPIQDSNYSKKLEE
jgi:hypothetical protein